MLALALGFWPTSTRNSGTVATGAVVEAPAERCPWAVHTMDDWDPGW